MLQQTSLKAYNELQDILRNQTYMSILEVLGRSGTLGMTDREIVACLGASDPNKIRPRRNELMKMGKLKETGKRICQVSGKTAIVWNIYTGVIYPPFVSQQMENFKTKKVKSILTR